MRATLRPFKVQTVAMPAPFTSQTVSDTSVADIETDEPTETLNTTIVPTPAMHLAADSTHPASSVCGAGAAGTSTDPPTFRDHSSYTEPAFTDHAASTDPAYFTTHPASSDPSLAPNMLGSTAIPHPYSSIHTTVTVRGVKPVGSGRH